MTASLKPQVPAGLSKFSRRTLLSVLAAWGLVLLCGSASLRAASSDTVQLFVQPMVTYGVTISSVNEQGYDFGTVALNSVTHSTAAIVVQNTGNVASRWQLRAAPSQNWQPGAAVGADQFVLMAVFTSSDSVAQVDTAEFTDGQDEVTADYQTSTGTVNSARYNAGVNMNAVPPSGVTNSKRNLWLKLKMPDSTASAEQQTFRLYITAVGTWQD